MLLPSRPPPPSAALRAQAQLLSDMRTSLKRSSPLENLATLTLSSPGLGLAALSAGSMAAPVSLVQFPVPAISEGVLLGPKGACARGSLPVSGDNPGPCRLRHVLVCSHPCRFAPAPVTPCLSALPDPRRRRPHHAQGSTTLRARAALFCWSRGASTCRKSLSRPWRTRAPVLAFSACSCLAPTASVRLRNGPSARRMI